MPKDDAMPQLRELPRYLVCCITGNGNPVQEPRDTLAEARALLDERRASGQYVRGFVLTEEDLVMYEFTVPAP